MLAVKGVFDGHEIKLNKSQLPHEPQQVIVTFLGTEQQLMHDDIYALASSGKSLEFLSSEEDIYSDSDLKVRFR